MENDNTFIYSTMFGKEIRCYFSEIVELKKNPDSLTLVLSNGKVHIENCAILSERFMEKIDGILEKNMRSKQFPE